MVLGAIVFGIDSLISLSVAVLLVYRNAYRMLILYPGLCWIHLSSLAVFWWSLLGFPCRVICKKWKFDFFFANLDAFYFFVLSNCWGWDFQYWCVEMQVISVHWFYILWHCWTHVSVLAVFWGRLSGFPCRVSCHLWKLKVWLLLCQFGCLLFHFVVWLLKLGLPTLC